MIALLRSLAFLLACERSFGSTCAGFTDMQPLHVRSSADLAEATRGAENSPVSIVLHGGVYQMARTLKLSSCSLFAASPHEDAEVVLKLAPSVPHPVVELHNVTSVSLSGIRILGHDSSPQKYMALDIAHGKQVSVDRVTVVGGISMKGGSFHKITRSDISNPSVQSHGNCVYLTQAGDPKTLTKASHEISNNEIHDCRGIGDSWPSSSYKPPVPNPDPYPNITGNGVLIDRTVGIVVRNNYVHDVNYHGIYTQGRLHAKYPDPNESPAALNVIELNHIKDFNQCVAQPVCKKYGYLGADGACVYFFTYLWGHGQQVLNNFCHQSRPDLWGGKGLYLDGTSSGILTHGNVIWNVSGNIIDNNNGHDNHHFGNIAIDGFHMGALTDSNFWPAKGGIHDAAHFSDGCHNPAVPESFNLTKTIMEYATSPAWRAQFPSILTWLNTSTWMGHSCDPHSQGMDCCMFPTGTVANYSIMVNTNGKGWQNLTANFCGNTNAFDEPVGCWPNDVGFQKVGAQKLYTEDPGFVDIARGNFALKKDSQVFKDFPGFPDIPFDEIGPRSSLGHMSLPALDTIIV